MRFVTPTALAALTGLFASLAAPSLAAAPAGPAPGHVRKHTGTPVPSPNRLPASQLGAQARPPQAGLPVEGPTGSLLIDRSGRVVGRAHPGFITHEPLVATRLNGLSTVIAGLAPDMRCDGQRCLYGDGLVWGTNAPLLLMYRSPDCSGRPVFSYHPSAAGFEAIAFAVDEPEGRFMYVARNAPYEALVRSFRRPGEEGCQREDTGEAGITESVLPLEAVYPAAAVGAPPLRWR